MVLKTKPFPKARPTAFDLLCNNLWMWCLFTSVLTFLLYEQWVFVIEYCCGGSELDFYISLTCLGHFALVILILKTGLPPFKRLLPEGCRNFTALWILQTWFIIWSKSCHRDLSTYKCKVLLLTGSLILTKTIFVIFFFHLWQ